MRSLRLLRAKWAHCCPLASGKEGEADVALDLFGGGDEWECVVSFTDVWSIHCHIGK